MAIKKLSIEDITGLAGEYCYIQREADGFILENSTGDGHTLGAFYSQATVTDMKIPLTENAYLPGVYETTENRVAFDDGKYMVRYCQSSGVIIAIEEWNILSDAIIGEDVNVASQNNIDFGALQKTSLNAATPAGIQNIPLDGSGFTALGDDRLDNLDSPVSSVVTSVLAGLTDLATTIATAVWAAAEFVPIMERRNQEMVGVE
jgi:hypothetical protein